MVGAAFSEAAVVTGVALLPAVVMFAVVVVLLVVMGAAVVVTAGPAVASTVSKTISDPSWFSVN